MADDAAPPAVDDGSGGAPAGDPAAEEVLPDFDPTVPNPARVYDYALGGKDNFPPDWAALRQLEEVTPGVAVAAQEHRGFLVRAVEAMTARGVGQFLDLGTGIPTSPNVHEVARRSRPDASVVYVDNDPTVLAHARVFLAKQPGAAVIGHDVRRPDRVLADPALLSCLDLSEPVGLLVVGVMHYVDGGLDEALMRRYRGALAPGSMMALSTFSSDDTPPAMQETTRSVFRPGDVHFRSRAQITALFEGFDLLEPGLASVGSWRNDGVDPSREVLTRGVLGGVAALR